MNCDKYVSQINDYLNNELNKADKKDFENCLNTNTEFKDLVDDIRRNDSYLGRLPDIETLLLKLYSSLSFFNFSI